MGASPLHNRVWYSTQKAHTLPTKDPVLFLRYLGTIYTDPCSSSHQWLSKPFSPDTSTPQAIMKIIILATLLALAAARPQEILSYDAETHSRLEQGVAGTAVSGQYRFTGPDGINYKIEYVADDNGYRATGDHLPVAPEVPVVPEAAPAPAVDPAPAADPAPASAPAEEAAPAPAPVAEPVAVEKSAPAAETAPEPSFRLAALATPLSLPLPVAADAKTAVMAPWAPWAPVGVVARSIFIPQPKVEWKFEPVKQFGYNIIY